MKKYKCFTEYENDIKSELDKLSDPSTVSNMSEKTPSFKNICLKVMRKHSEKVLLKYKQLLVTKIHNFTRQVDLKTLLSDANIVNFEVIFYDKSMNQLYKNSNYKLSPFDMCSSICWSSFDDLGMSPDIVRQVEIMRIYSKISLFLQISNNKVLKPFSTLSNSKSNTITKRTLLYENKVNLRNFDESQVEKLFSNSMINLYLCDKDLLVAFWKSDDTV